MCVMLWTDDLLNYDIIHRPDFLLVEKVEGSETTYLIPLNDMNPKNIGVKLVLPERDEQSFELATEI